ncbi:MAG: electron transfer flavoprotein subunit beta/FixA family protein [Desulfobacteraceae bacterium]|jgi:electron transfer flavoprotein beta subunit
MNILVLIKQVPQTEAATEINPAGSYIERSPVTLYKMNRFDEYALEEALRIKETCPETRVDVITLGPEHAKEVIRRAYGMGADNGIHILADNSNYLDPSAVAARIGEEAAKGNYDLIFAGIMSEDMMQSQTGQMVAEVLGLPCVSSVVALTLDERAGKVMVKRELEGGVRHSLEADMPVVLTVQAGINTPRYPTLSKVLKANGKDITTITENPVPPRQTCVLIRYPEKQRAGVVVEGSRADKVRELARILRQKNIMR